MKNIVITGSTRGIGRGLAEAFLDLGCAVTVSGRTRRAVDATARELAANHDAERMVVQPCDVTDYRQVKALWLGAHARFGQIDIWINNAGIGHAQRDTWLL
ncbi:MAG: SDR family NAD(P)-dependent oxidoreductase, partial [Anaerolineales bacterium]